VCPGSSSSGWRQSIPLLRNPVATVPLLIFILAVAYAAQVNFLDAPDALFFYLRMLNPGNGLSPLLPLFFVGAAAILWLASNLQRLRLLEEFPAQYVDTDPVAKSHQNVQHRLTCASSALPGAYCVLLSVGLPCGYLFLWKLTPALERPLFYWLFGMAFVAVYIALSLSFWRLWLAWWSTRDLLRRLAAHPMHRAHKSLVARFSRAPRITFSNPSTIFSALEFSVDQGARLVTAGSRLGAPGSGQTPLESQRVSLEKLRTCVADAQQSTAHSDYEEASGNWSRAIRLRSQAHGSLSQASRLVVDLLKPYWSSPAAVASPEIRSWYTQAEYFLAGRTAVFVHHLFLHLKNLLFCGMAGLLLMLLAVSSYPFQPGDQLLMFNWLIILTAVTLTVALLVQINRSSIISFLTGTSPGQVNWNQDFITKIIIYGIVPILALVGAQFPESLKSIVSWFGGSQGLR
ncbi:MAG TPA: hypothetical protein VFY83_15795, partial [Anaerolineales bacterium]|nr:hypothetical protein [Anaerolineales bacterium]